MDWSRTRLRTGIPGSEILADLLYPVVPETELNRQEDNLDGFSVQRNEVRICLEKLL